MVDWLKTKLEKKQRKTMPKTTFRTLYYYWRAGLKHKWLALACLIITPISIFVRGILAPYIFADVIGKVSSGLSGDELVQAILPEAIAFLGIFMFSGIILDRIRLYTCWKFEMLTMYELDTLSFNAISAQSMQFHNNRFSGSLVSQTNKFSSAFERLFDTIVWQLIPFLVYVIATVIILFPLAPGFTWALIGLIVVYSIIALIYSSKISYLNEQEAEATNRQTGQLADSITNIMAVKSFGREAHERRRFANFQRGFLSATRANMRACITRDVFFGFVNSGIMAAMLVFIMMGSTWFSFSVSTLVLILTYTNTILGDLWDLNNIFKNFNRVFGDASEMTLNLDAEDDVVDLPGATDLTLKSGAVDFSHITFQHQDAKAPIFEDFSLQIKAGERVGLVGMSGSGKTTLTKLLLRFADVTDGQILLDDQDIKHVKQVSLRERIAYVPQETSLFHRSVADNIAYARPEASREEVVRAAKLANADEFIDDLPDGYDTLVGERGVKLSGGQRQRIAIARAILKDAPILVLDEATSALDSESEALIQDALGKLMKGRTCIVIAHRLSTVSALDRIVVLEDGQIAEQGSHAELLKHSGPYQKLWSRQSGAFEE